MTTFFLLKKKKKKIQMRFWEENVLPVRFQKEKEKKKRAYTTSQQRHI